MKKILLILLVLTATIGYAQKPKVQVVRYLEVTTAERDALVVPAGEHWEIWNETTTQKEVWNGTAWVSPGGSALDLSADYTWTGVHDFESQLNIEGAGTARLNVLNTSNLHASALYADFMIFSRDAFNMTLQTPTLLGNHTLTFPAITKNETIATSVGGVSADASGNIDIPIGVSSGILTASRNLIPADPDLLSYSGATDITITVDTDANAGFTEEKIYVFYASGVGNIIIDFSAVTVNGISGSTAQTYTGDKSITIKRTGTDTWDVIDPPVETIQKRGRIAFIFDDGWESDYTNVKAIFESRNITCGFAPVTRLINVTNRTTANQLLELQKDGFEILAHSKNHVAMNTSTAMGVKRAESEIKQSVDYLRYLGIEVNGWVTPLSIMDDIFIDKLKPHVNYAFTKSHGESPNTEYDDAYKLSRFGLESYTVAQAQAQADAAVLNNQDIIFYAHDVVDATQEETDLETLLDYCISQGYEILNPSDVLNKSFEFKAFDKYVKPESLFTGEMAAWNVVNGTGVLASGVYSVTPDASDSAMIIQKQVDVTTLSRTFVNDEEISFSIDADLSAGTEPASCSIGIKFTDSGASTLYIREEAGFTITADGIRFKINAQIPENTDDILIYLRVTVSDAATEVEIKEPIITTGDNILYNGATFSGLTTVTESDVNSSIATSLGLADTALQPTGNGSGLTNVNATQLGGYASTSYFNLAASNTATGTFFKIADNTFYYIGDGGDVRILHDGTNNLFRLYNGDWVFQNVTTETVRIAKTGDITSLHDIKADTFSLDGLNTAPASATATGTTGEIRVVADYIYICTATNTWVRAALSTW